MFYVGLTTRYVAFELQQMRDLLEVLSTSLLDFEHKLENTYTIEDLENMDDNAQDEYEHYIDIFQSVMGDFPRRLYCSFLVSWYSFVEEALSQLCVDLNIEIPIRYQDQERFGSGIQRAKKFLTETGQVEIINDHWQELNYIRKIRNQIVHEGGKFQQSIEKPLDNAQVVPFTNEETTYYIRIEKSLYDYLERHSLDHFYLTLLINPPLEYCYYLVDFGEKFFSKVLDDLKLI